MMNTTTAGQGNMFKNFSANAAKAVNSAANTAVKAANVVSNSVLGPTTDTAQNAAKAANSFSFNSLLPFGSNANANKKNNSGANAGKNGNGNSNSNALFTNVNAANLGNSGNSGKSMIPTELPSWAWPIGIFLLLVGIFVMVFVFFKNEIQVAYDNLVSTIRRALGYSSGEVEVPTPGSDVVTQPPSQSEKATQFADQQKSIVEKVLPLGSKEVFNVSDNNYNFYDAEPLCRALGAELASYDQVKDAWEKGADWCNYGWVKGQVAVYPTQKETWDKLQHGPEDEKFACGEPGVNGGYFDNPEMRFGVNCYGVKPSQSSNDEKVLMEKGSIPKTPATLKVDQQIQEYKANMDQVGILPFNTGQWSS